MSFLWTEYNYEDEQRVLRKEALAEGRAEERLANVNRMKDNGLSIKDISKYLGISEDEVRQS